MINVLFLFPNQIVFVFATFLCNADHNVYSDVYNKNQAYNKHINNQSQIKQIRIKFDYKNLHNNLYFSANLVIARHILYLFNF